MVDELAVADRELVRIGCKIDEMERLLHRHMKPDGQVGVVIVALSELNKLRAELGVARKKGTRAQLLSRLNQIPKE